MSTEIDTHNIVLAELLDGRKAGRIAHQLIAQLARDGAWDAPTILARVGSLPALAQIGSYEQAARQRLATAAGVYHRFFVPQAPVVLEGCEISVPGGRLDLLWFDPSRDLRWADELKTHRLRDLGSDHALLAQLERQAAGAGKKLDGFVGVRACLLSAPRDSILMRPDGSRCAPAEAGVPA